MEPPAKKARSAAPGVGGGGSGKAAPVLPWMRVPITIDPGSGTPVDQVHGLDDRLRAALLAGFRYRELFPVQAVVWEHSGGGLSTAHDLCVAAPTGSGKTLAYALPVVNALAALRGRSPQRCLQALVVLPTRDLASQVYEVFKPLCEAVGLRVALAAAHATVAAEAAELVGLAAPLPLPLATPPPPAAATATAKSKTKAKQGAVACTAGVADCTAYGALGPPEGEARCRVDVVVATPGRLMAHLTSTPGFHLGHLRFLVVDETDRLLRQSYQDWLPRVLAEVEAPGAAHFAAPPPQTPSLGTAGAAQGLNLAALGWGLAADGGCGWPAASLGAALPYAQPRLVKVVVSATLTRDPAKLQRLSLHAPRYVATVANTAPAAAGSGGAAGGASAAAAAGGSVYSLPKSLDERRVLCSAARKPLVLVALLRQLAGQATIVFTSSVDMTHKLYLLLASLPRDVLADGVVEYSSHLSPKQRAANLAAFRAGSARVLVASDAMTRGMDVEGVANVVNYDAPVYAKTYVHRAGRTARAGRSGRVFTLLRDEDMRHFKAMIRKADNNFVKDHKLPPEQVEALRPALQGALQQVQALLASEKASEASRRGLLHGAGGGGGGGGARAGGGAAATARTGQGGRTKEQQQQQEQQHDLEADGELMGRTGRGLVAGDADRGGTEGEGQGGKAGAGSKREAGGGGEGRGTKKRRKGDT